MDEIDRRILTALQDDCSGSVNEIAERAGVSASPCWRRIKRLEDEGYIRRRVALLDQDKLNLGVTGFVLIRTSRHDAAWLERFAAGVCRIPEVVEVHRMTGEVDYLLKIVAPDIAGYDAIYKRLIQVAELTDVSASFSMERLKSTTALPLDYAKD
jgi:Lrp/AsnC family transcriptional regulator